MPNNVAINITSIQDNGKGQEENKITTSTTGQLYKKQNTYYLKYKGVVEGLKGVKTTVKIKEKSIKLIRRGKVETTQVFLPEEKTKFVYQTPYGKLKFAITVDKLNIAVGPTQGNIKLEYNLLGEEGEIISDNYLYLEYEED